MSTAETRSTVGLYGLLSALLLYPNKELRAEFPELARAADGLASPSARRSIARFLAEIEGLGAAELEAAYVRDFDFDREATLHLTFHRYGDQRERGTQLARLARLYADAGFAIDGGELPDYLPIVLEFTDLVGPEEGGPLLNEVREPIELVRARLRERGSPYFHLLDAVTAALPELTRAQRDAVRRLAEAEPPTELVGLPTFGNDPMPPPMSPGCGS